MFDVNRYSQSPQNSRKSLIEQSFNYTPSNLNQTPGTDAIIKGDFYENLAGTPFDYDLQDRLKQQIDREFDARTLWFEQITSGLKALGIVQPKSDAPSTKNPDLINSTFMETFIRITAQFSEELFQPNNICVGKVRNPKQFDSNPDKVKILNEIEDIAALAQEDIKHKISYQYDDFMSQLERGLQSCFLTGSTVYKIYYDEMLRRPVVRFIQPEHVIISPQAPSIHTAEMVTHIFCLSRTQVEAYVESGFFTNVDFLGNPDENTYAETVARQRTMNSGTDLPNTEDNMFPLYWFGETEILLSAQSTEDKFILNNPFYSDSIKRGFVPYRIINHLSTGTIVNRTRAWKKENYYEIVRNSSLFHIQFLPGDDFWGMGLNSTCIQLHNQATTLQYEFTMAARYVNNPVLVIDKDALIKDSTIEFKPGTAISLQTTGVPIRDVISDVPFKEPSPAMLEMLRDVERKITSCGGILTQTYDSIPSNTDAQVLLALMDREQKPMSGVLKRIIRGINYMFESLQRIMSEDMGDCPFGDGSLGKTNKEVYGQPIQLLSSCNPTLASSSVRIVQMQLILNYALQAPQLHNMTELYKELYTALKIENINKVLLTEEQVAQQQQQQAQQAQAQAEAAQKQQDFMNEQTMFQNQLMDKDLEIKASKDKQQMMLKYMEMIYKYMAAREKLNVDLLKEKGENIKQDNIEETQLYKTYTDLLLAREELQAQLGRELPIVLPPQLKKLDIETEIHSLNEMNAQNEMELQAVQQQMVS